MKKLFLVALAIMLSLGVYSQQIKINKTFVVADRTTAFGEEVKISDFIYVTSDSNLYITKVALGRSATATYLLASPARYSLVNSGGSSFTTGHFTDDVTMDSTLAVALGTTIGGALTVTSTVSGAAASFTTVVTSSTITAGSNILGSGILNVVGGTGGGVNNGIMTLTADGNAQLVLEDSDGVDAQEPFWYFQSATNGVKGIMYLGYGDRSSGTTMTGTTDVMLVTPTAVTLGTVDGTGAISLNAGTTKVTTLQTTVGDTTGLGSTATLGMIVFKTSDGVLYCNAGTTTPTWTALH